MTEREESRPAELKFYIVSVTHTQRRDAFISFWRPDNAGYCWPLSWAGHYEEEAVQASLSYYNDGQLNIAVRADVVDAIAVTTPPGRIDGDAGPVVLNDETSWRKMRAALIAEPEHPVCPCFRGSRRKPVELRA